VNVLWLFDTTGWIIGPVMLITGLLALVLCLRANNSASSPRAVRAALIASLLPLAAGVCAIGFGWAVVWYSGKIPEDTTGIWLALGKACLAGLVVSLVPLSWSLGLLWGQRRG
jgi:hypothetical protein